MPLLPVYADRTSLEEDGLPTSDWTPARFNRLLLTVGNFIDRYTQQRFICYEETVHLSGSDRCIIERPDRLPILSVSSIQVDAAKSTRAGQVFGGTLRDVAVPYTGMLDEPVGTYMVNAVWEFPQGSYVIRSGQLPRYIETVRGLFPGGASNVAVTGVFGWPELSSVKSTPFQTTTTADITPTSTTISLASVAGLRLRDVLIVGGYPFITKSISGLNVTIDPPTGILTSNIASGTAAVSHGAVPFDIQRILMFLAVREVSRQASWSAGNFQDPSLIMSEKTDKYEYKMFAPAQTIGFGKAPGLTGVAEIDELLAAYTAPPSVEFA